MTYREETAYLKMLGTADADALACHGNPAIRKTAGLVRRMAVRHQHGEFDAKDDQDCESILFFAGADEIRHAL